MIKRKLKVAHVAGTDLHVTGHRHKGAVECLKCGQRNHRERLYIQSFGHTEHGQVLVAVAGTDPTLACGSGVKTLYTEQRVALLGLRARR